MFRKPVKNFTSVLLKVPDMKVFSDLSTPIPLPQNTSIAIGYFDGVHIAHQSVIAQTLSDAPALTPAVFTFRTEGRHGFKGVPMLTTDQQKLQIFESLGIQAVFFPSFSDVKPFSPQEFVHRVLRDVCAAQHVACGFDFHFGRGGAAGASQMQALCRQAGMSTHVVPEILVDGHPVSSTWVRQLLQDGLPDQAARLLGRPFSFTFQVRHGRKLGRTIGVPTMNQHFPPGFVEPKFGVYVSRVRLDGGTFPGITNIGVKPTVGSDSVVAETFIEGFCGDLYGKPVEVQLRKFLREERKFPSLDALREQIAFDRQAAAVWASEHQ